MIRITSLTHLGSGKTDDGTLIDAPVLPGEEVELADGKLRILTPSADRVRPICTHVKSCGGCQFQHASDAFVADWKVSIVKNALQAHGLQAEFRPLQTSEIQSRRRAKFTGRRSKSGVLIGFHGKASHTVIATPECQLITPELRASFPALEQVVLLSCSRKGEVALTVTQSLAGLDVWVQTQKELTSQLRQDLAALAQRYHLARVTWNDEPVITCHPPAQRMGVAQVVPPAGAFLQATQSGQQALTAAVCEAVLPAKRVADLFCGVGTFTLPLAKHAEVLAFEGEREMISALDLGWRNAQGLKHVQAQVRDLFRRPLEPDEFKGIDAVVIDPPRAGASAQVQTLAQADVAKVAMVSCNPVTFARDLSALVASGYHIEWVQVIDQFRWSAHIECVASLKKS